jgi:PKD repeat protein
MSRNLPVLSGRLVVAGWLLPLVALLLGSGWGCGGGDSRKAESPRADASAEGQSQAPVGLGGAQASAAEPRGSGSGNQPPRASFEVFPLLGYAGLTAMRFNATASRDDSTDSANLLKRWDFDGDGTWDQEFQHATRTRYVYERAGRFRPRLLVEDTGGLRDSIIGSELVIDEPCPAPDFELSDLNPHSRSHGQKVRLSQLRGHRVLVWYATPSG